MHLCIQHSPTMYLTRNHEDGDELLFTPSAAANTSGNVLGRLDFFRNSKDRMHDCDERQCDNKHRFALSSTRRLQYKEVKVVKVPYSGSPSPTFSEIPFYSF
jgi:hypothetical protein